MDKKLKEAKEAAVFNLPSINCYPNAPNDMINGLQKRDMKLATAITENLLKELNDLILPTFLIPLTLKQAKALVSSYGVENINKCSKDNKDILLNLAKLIDNHVKQLNTINNKFFIKLSFMSPKDVIIRPSNIETIQNIKLELDSLFKQIRNPKTISLSSYAITRAWLNALYKSIGVYNGIQAIEILIQSYRINGELLESIQVEEYYGNTQIVLRPWINIKPGFEFRVFVSNKHVTAISQYESVYYPELWHVRNEIFDNIYTFVSSKVIPKLEYRLLSFIVDIIMTDNNQLYVCELNPFASTSSACLFSWRNNREILLIGPLEYRIVPPPSLINNVLELSAFDKDRTLRYYNIIQDNKDNNNNSLIMDDATDSYGLSLKKDWEVIIGTYWKSKISSNYRLYIIIPIIIIILGIYLTIY